MFLLFSQDLPTNDLGFVASKAITIEVDVDGHTYELEQSPGILTSQRGAGTTGAVLWKVTPLFAEWLASSPRLLQDAGILSKDSVIVELGCGITGLIGIVMAHKVSRYILTDQAYIMKTLNNNIKHNSPPVPRASTRKASLKSTISNLVTASLDWEIDEPSGLLSHSDDGGGIDLVVACDCVYNEYLIQPLVDTMSAICRTSRGTHSTTVLIAQQLRSESILESFLEAMILDFEVWRLPDEHLSQSLRFGSGYVLHMARLREGSPL